MSELLKSESILASMGRTGCKRRRGEKGEGRRGDSHFLGPTCHCLKNKGR